MTPVNLTVEGSLEFTAESVLPDRSRGVVPVMTRKQVENLCATLRGMDVDDVLHLDGTILYHFTDGDAQDEVGRILPREDGLYVLTLDWCVTLVDEEDEDADRPERIVTVAMANALYGAQSDRRCAVELDYFYNGEVWYLLRDLETGGTFPSPGIFWTEAATD